ncbi:MAG: adenylosuccinate lyase, partial [Candidatus Hermodarchaeota archaeon]
IGSSTMPHKRNPINFENIKSAWKKFMPYIITIYMSQISEHEGDLTNSLSLRYIPELIMMFDSSLIRAINVIKKLKINRDKMKKNLLIKADKIISEPLQILLAQRGFSEAYQKIRELCILSLQDGVPFLDVIFKDEELKPYLQQLDKYKLNYILKPENYIGKAIEKTDLICDFWEKKINTIIVNKI